jgi:hypothetical protein
MEVINYFKFEMNPLEGKSQYGEVLLEALRLDGLRWYISSGTALGLYRDGDYIPQDTDIDIGIIAEPGVNLRQNVINRLEMQLVREITHEGMPMQLAFMHNDIIFDVYFYYIQPDGTFINHNDQGDMVKQPFEIRTRDTKYGVLPFPHPIEDYMVMRYGKDWKIPSNKKGLYTKEF